VQACARQALRQLRDQSLQIAFVGSHWGAFPACLQTRRTYRNAPPGSHATGTGLREARRPRNLADNHLC
jgi:hypothetical protein